MAGRVSFKTADSSYPKQGNRELPVTLDFTNSTTLYDDLTPEQSASQIESVQSVFIDNADNPTTLILQFQDTMQRIVAQPFTQGVYPVISAGGIRYKAVTSQGQKIQIIFSNTEKQFVAYGAIPGVLVVPALTNIPLNFQPLAAGDNQLIAGVANQTIKVYRMLITFGAGTNIQFFDGPSAGAIDLTGLMNMFAGGSMMLQASGVPWFTCAIGDALILNSSAGVNMGGMIGYVQN